MRAFVSSVPFTTKNTKNTTKSTKANRDGDAPARSAELFRRLSHTETQSHEQDAGFCGSVALCEKDFAHRAAPFVPSFVFFVFFVFFVVKMIWTNRRSPRHFV